MTQDSFDDDSEADRYGYINTLAAAKRWLAKAAQQAEATLTIPEPQPLGNGLVMVNAVLERADGSKANICIRCLAGDEMPEGKVLRAGKRSPPSAERVRWN